ncbi:MAG: glycosyltransferase family 4 protein [Pseudomonadota bacterium]
MAVVLSSALVSLVLAWLVRKRAVLDVPNDRSAHRSPVPTGGGIGIFIATGLVVLALVWGKHGWPHPYPLLLGLALLLMLSGWADDRLNLPVALRLSLYVMVCAVAVLRLLPDQSVWVWGMALLYSLWMVNLFNFMDGIDGIAASQAAFVLLASACLSWALGGEPAFHLFCSVVAGACLGFLYWNWAPARLFMGDAGSVPLGFLLAALALWGEASGSLPLATSLLLSAVFISDTSYTLACRALRRERITQAHSQHLYQRLSRYWGRHDRVVLLMLAYNLCWLFPLAALATVFTPFGTICLVLAYAPLLALLLKAGKLP